MENYEQRYKDALERTTQSWECGDITRETLEYIFPELKESEDERIRRSIICGMNALKDQKKETFAAVPIDDCITWLEKQSEKQQSTIMWHDVSEEPKGMKELLVEWGSKDDTWHDVAFYGATTKSFRVCSNRLVGVTRWCYIDDIIKKQEPKWTKEDESKVEDEKIRKNIITIINNYVDNSNTFKSKMLAWLESQGEQKSILDELEMTLSVSEDGYLRSNIEKLIKEFKNDKQ